MSDLSLDAGTGARIHRDLVHDANVCAKSGLWSPAAVQAAVARSGAQCAFACSPQRSALCDSDATVASGEETLLDDGGGAKFSSVRD